MECVLLIGAPGSGKTSFYTERLLRTHVRVSLDVLRTRRKEGRFVELCLETGQRFVVDNTSPTAADRARYIAPAKAARFRVVGYFFRSRIDEVLARNAGRSGKARIPDAGVRSVHAKLEVPSLSEGFDELSYVWIDDGRGFVVEEWRDEVR